MPTLAEASLQTLGPQAVGSAISLVLTHLLEPAGPGSKDPSRCGNHQF